MSQKPQPESLCPASPTHSMARAQVCRFYDDGTTTTALRRPVKRLPEFQSSSGLFYSTKGRRPQSFTPILHIPRTALFQAVFVFAALIVIFFSNVASPLASHHTSDTAIETLSDKSRPPATVHLPRDKQQHENSSVKPQVRSHEKYEPKPDFSINIPESQVRHGVSLVAVCMGRHETIKMTAPAWLAIKGVDEIILVDWSSEPPLESAIRAIPGGDRIRIIRVNGESKWVLSRAYNLAINATHFSHVIRTDCDYHVEPDFVAAHRDIIENDANTTSVSDRPTNLKYFAGNYDLARNENEVHLNGAVFIKRKDFLNVGGYDERIQTYGWDDEDLYNRLHHAGFKKLNISYDHVSHVSHDNTGRAQSGVKFATVEIDLNSLLLSKLKPWSKNIGMGTHYDEVKGASSKNRLVLEAASRPKSLQELVSESDYESAWAEALGRRLHDSYFVPWDIIAALHSKHKEFLLRRLMKRTENRERAKRAELDASGRKNEIVDINSLPVPRVLVCHCMHGLGNRLRALASCMSFAKETSRELIVVWEPDSHIEAKFSDLYKSPIVLMEKMPVRWPFEGVEKWDIVWEQFKFHNYMEMEGDGALKGEKIIDVPNKHMYYKGAYIMEVENYELTNWDKDNTMLRTLDPVDEVASMVRSLDNKGLGTDNVVGLHVRNRTLDQDIKNVDFIKEYGSEATKTMDMWRQKSGVHNFIKVMDQLIKEKGSIKFFVATDTYEVIDELEGIYGTERILSFKRSCDDRDGTCVRYALADLYALSKCKVLYGSNWSSFTEVAMRLGGVKAKLAGEDFGA